MKKYTYDQIVSEMEILKRTFSIVRLVDPVKCLVSSIDTPADDTRLTETPCYQTWECPFQCVNCTSIRALQTDNLYTKYEMYGDKLCHITSRPVIVDDKALVLELVQQIECVFGNPYPESLNLTATIRDRNQRLLHDTETPAYNKRYLSEHLPNIIHEAQQSGGSNSALVRIENLAEVIHDSGPVAASGLMCGLYDVLLEIFSDCHEDTLLLARYSNDTFFIMEKHLGLAEFKSRIHTLEKAARPERILFQNAQLPFRFQTAYVCIGAERITSEDDLLYTLESRLAPNAVL